MKWYSEFVGIPFVSKGRTLRGADCYGIVSLVLQSHYGIILPELLGYSNAMEHSEVQAVINENTPLISGEKLDKPEEGCIVVLSSQGLSAHVGVVVDTNMMLHTTKGIGSVVEPLTSRRIKNRIRGYYRVDKSYSTT